MENTASLRSRLFPLLAAASLAPAAGTQLEGVVQDRHGNPVPGIVVSLDPLDLRDTTDAQGRWSLESSLSGIQSAPATKIRQGPSSLTLELASSANVQADVFDARGARVGGLPSVRMEPGNHNLELKRHGTGIRWLRLSIDGKTQVLPMGLGSTTRTAPNLEAGARTMAATGGILTYAWQGDTICIRPLDSLRQSGIRQTLRKLHIASNAFPDPDNPVETLQAVFDLANTTPVRKFGLHYTSLDEPLPGNGTFLKGLVSGDLYLPMDSSIAKPRQRAWIHVLGNGQRRIGLSDTMDLPGDADTLRFDSALHLSNALPSGRILAGSIQSTFTPQVVEIAMSQRHKLGIGKIEWNVDGAGYLVGGARKSMKWSWPGRTRHEILCRVTDVDGNVFLTGTTISVCHLDSLGKVPDRTVMAGEGFTFEVFVADTDGVAMTIVDFGDGTRDTVYGGPSLWANHAYPVVPSVDSSDAKTYRLTVIRVDAKGNRDSTSSRITVTNPRPSFWVDNTVGEVGTRLQLQVVSLNAGQLAKVEWGVGALALATGRSDTTIELPQVPTEDYPVHVRVTDERGNMSAVDTVRVRVRQGVRITDARDGQRYRIVTIGKQTWMAQNLIYRQTTGTKDTFGICLLPDQADCAKYGRLYTWAEAMVADSAYNRKIWPGGSARRQGLCPTGWHIPSRSEWEELIATAGGWERAGARLKSAGGWIGGDSTGFGTDDFWFSAHPSTPGVVDNRLQGFGEGAWWWSTAQETNPTDGKYTTDFRTFNTGTGITFSASEKSGTESLRCLKD